MTKWIFIFCVLVSFADAQTIRRRPPTYYNPGGAPPAPTVLAPFISSWTRTDTTSAGAGEVTIRAQKPAGSYPGSGLIIMVSSEANNSTAQWNNTTLKPTGFTLINESGNTTTDCHTAAFYRVEDGTEADNIYFDCATAIIEKVCWYVRLINIDTSAMLDQTGSDVNTTGTATSIDITGVTSTVDSSLAMFVMSFDGGDDGGFTTTGTGWSEYDEHRTGTAAANAAGSFGTHQVQGTTVASGTVNVAWAAGTEGGTGFQWSIKGGVFIDTTCTPTEAPATIVLSTPTDTQTGVSTTPTFTWEASAAQYCDVTYQLQVDDDNGFGSPEIDSTGITIASAGGHALTASTTYYWRVRATNGFGTGSYPTAFSFTTAAGGGGTAARTGTASQVDGSAASGSTSVTVPSDCNLVVAFWDHWDNNGSSTLSTLTLNGVTLLPAKSELAEGAVADEDGVGVALLVSPATGSQTLAWAWSAGGARQEGGEIVLVYVKNGNIGDPYRAAGTDANTTFGNVAVTLSTETTDLLLAIGKSYSGGGPPVLDGTVFINDAAFNSQEYDVSEVTPSATSTTVNMTGEGWSSMGAISLK